MKKQEQVCIAVCNKTGKLVLMEFSNADEEWICLHKGTRKEEIEDIKRFVKENL